MTPGPTRRHTTLKRRRVCRLVSRGAERVVSSAVVERHGIQRDSCTTQAELSIGPLPPRPRRQPQVVEDALDCRRHQDHGGRLQLQRTPQFEQRSMSVSNTRLSTRARLIHEAGHPGRVESSSRRDPLSLGIFQSWQQEAAPDAVRFATRARSTPAASTSVARRRAGSRATACCAFDHACRVQSESSRRMKPTTLPFSHRQTAAEVALSVLPVALRPVRPAPRGSPLPIRPGAAPPRTRAFFSGYFMPAYDGTVVIISRG